MAFPARLDRNLKKSVSDDVYDEYGRYCRGLLLFLVLDSWNRALCHDFYPLALRYNVA